MQARRRRGGGSGSGAGATSRRLDKNSMGRQITFMAFLPCFGCSLGYFPTVLCLGTSKKVGNVAQSSH